MPRSARHVRPRPLRGGLGEGPRRRDGTRTGGADRVRTDDPLLAKQVLSQLSYSPERGTSAANAATLDAGILCGHLGVVKSCSKGGDPAAPSDTATLLRLHPSHEPLRGKRPPCG